MWELLWLLLPVAAGSGWWLGRRSTPNDVHRKLVAPDTDALKGINYLLNEQQDAALNIFLRMVAQDPETVDIQLALGSLFRRRGEVERAIRIHQTLIARPDLGNDERTNALFELARDYMSAGLLDRAERVLQTVIDSSARVDEALDQLLHIYERERDWGKAIEIARRLQRRGNSMATEVIAHYYCELAEEAITRGDLTAARGQLKKARGVDENSVRANILSGDVAMHEGKYREAVRAYTRVESQDLGYVPEIIERMLVALTNGASAYATDAYIDKVRKRDNDFAVTKAVMEVIRQRDGHIAAEKFLREQIERRPSLRGLRAWVAGTLDKVRPENRESVRLTKELLDKVLEHRPAYRCAKCGFAGNSLHWHCPSCARWGSVRPIIGVEGE